MPAKAPDLTPETLTYWEVHAVYYGSHCRSTALTSREAVRAQIAFVTDVRKATGIRVVEATLTTTYREVPAEGFTTTDEEA
jgi:hypothetical protein